MDQHQPYWQVLRNTTLTPLNLDSTYVPVFESYQPIAGTNYEGVLYTGYFCTSFATSSPGNGEIASTPAEMVQWYQAIFNGSFLSAASKSQLLTFEPSSVYSLGLQELVSPRLGGEYYHSGWVGAFTSETGFDKDSKASFFIALNTLNDSVNTSQYLRPLLNVFTKEMPKKANDASITTLVSPTGIVCNPSITPTVTLKNNGSAPLTAVTSQVKVGTALASTYSWTGTLAPAATTTITLPAAPITNGMHDVKIYTTSPNGAVDGYSWNDTFRTRLGANLMTPLGYFSEDFEGQTMPILVWNTRNGMEVQAGVSHLSGYNSLHSLARNNADYSGDALIRFRIYNGNGNNIYLDDIDIGTPTGIATVNQSALQVYPNPATEQVTITGLPEGSTMILSDITGKVLLPNQNHRSWCHPGYEPFHAGCLPAAHAAGPAENRKRIGLGKC